MLLTCNWRLGDMETFREDKNTYLSKICIILILRCHIMEEYRHHKHGLIHYQYL